MFLVDCVEFNSRGLEVSKGNPRRTALQSVISPGVLVFYMPVYSRPVHYVLIYSRC